MLQDRMIQGAVSGILAKAVYNVLEFPLWKVGIISHPVGHYIQSIFIQPEHHLFFGTAIGFVADYVYATFLGVIFIYFLVFAGMRYAYVKGMLYGAFLWMASYGVLRSLPVVTFRQVIPQDVLPQLILHIIYGWALGWIVSRLKAMEESKTH